MAMSLDKINKIVADFERLADEGNKIISGFLYDLTKETDADTAGYWGTLFPDSADNFLKSYIREIKSGLRNMIVQQYKDLVCPNLNNIYDHLDYVKYRGRDRNDEDFDAVKLVEHLNQKILVDLEQLTYNQMLMNAKQLFRNYDDVRNIITGFLPLQSYKNSVSGRKSYKVDHYSTKAIVDFESFAALLIQNKQLFYRTAPSQFQYQCPVASFVQNMESPITVENIGYFKKVNILKNGEINFLFNSYDDYKTVKEALQGKQPKIYFPEAKIDVTQLFTRDRQTQYKRTVSL